MRNILYIAIILIMTLASCSENIKDVNPEIDKTEVSFDIKTTDNLEKSKVSKVGEYDRGSAPVYVSGVNIEAIYQEAVDNIVEGTFNYVDMGESGIAISMLIPFGSNKFEARSIATYSAASEAFLNDIEKASGDEAKNVFYSAKLIEKLPIYAIFNGETIKTITESDKSVDIAMTTNNARYSVVLETSDKYDIDMSVICNGASLEILKANNSKASAVVFNNADLEGAHDVLITLKIYAKGKSELLKTIEVKDGEDFYATKGGVNNTLVLNYNADGELYTIETGINFSWTPMLEEGEIVDVN